VLFLIAFTFKLGFQLFSLLLETRHYLESSDSQENWDADPKP
jgi:hypothetical protein